jgi:hypothetical protein
VTSPVINLQDWPGREGVSAKPSRRQPFDRLGDRSGLVLVVAAERYATEECFGLGAFLSITGQSVHGAGLVVPDDLPEREAEALQAWCASHSVNTPAGPRPWECLALSDLFDYRTGVFTRRVYCGAGWLVTADLGRTLGLVAEVPTAGTEWGVPRGNFWRGGIKLHLRTWAEPDKREGRGGVLDPVSPHRSALRVKTAGAHGYFAQFACAPGGPSTGKRNPDGTAYRGRFLDVVQAAYVFDGVDSGDLGDHMEAFGFDRLDLPAAVTLDAEGAEQMAGLVEAVRSLALVLDEEASKWFTTSGDRARGYNRVDLGRLVSPAGLAAEIPRKAGVTPPLLKFSTPDDAALSRWMGAHRGGWLSAELAGERLFPAVDIDVHSAYPAFAALLGWWRLKLAAQLRRQDKTEELRALCAEVAAGDVSAFFDRRTWRHFDFTICEVVCDGEPWPVEAPDESYPQGHSGVRPVRCPVPFPFTWPDVVNAALLSGRVPHIVSATRLVPVGRQPGLRDRYPLYDGLVLGIDDDPAVALVRLRDKAKDRGDVRLAAQLRVVVNTLCYGNPVRLDLGYRQEGRRRVVTETAAEWTFPPIAVTVTAASRLALGLAEKLLDPSGIIVASRDTDGLLLRCTPDQWSTLDRVLARFDALDPFGTGQPFWKVQREQEGRPLHGLVIGVKRYVLATLDDTGTSWKWSKRPSTRSADRSSTHRGWQGTTQRATAGGPGRSPLSPSAVRSPAPGGRPSSCRSGRGRTPPSRPSRRSAGCRLRRTRPSLPSAGASACGLSACSWKATRGEVGTPHLSHWTRAQTLPGISRSNGEKVMAHPPTTLPTHSTTSAGRRTGGSGHGRSTTRPRLSSYPS